MDDDDPLLLTDLGSVPDGALAVVALLEAGVVAFDPLDAPAAPESPVAVDDVPAPSDVDFFP